MLGGVGSEGSVVSGAEAVEGSAGSAGCGAGWTGDCSSEVGSGSGAAVGGYECVIFAVAEGVYAIACNAREGSIAGSGGSGEYVESYECAVVKAAGSVVCSIGISDVCECGYCVSLAIVSASGSCKPKSSSA